MNIDGWSYQQVSAYLDALDVERSSHNVDWLEARRAAAAKARTFIRRRGRPNAAHHPWQNRSDVQRG